MGLIDQSRAADRAWWRDAVCYEVYVRSFADSDGDGVGDLPGVTARLPYLAWLGVDAVWLTPFYASPQHDHGYDVADYHQVDPLFGDLAAAEELIATAHEHGIRVIVDIVPNHTSSEHEWFRQALAAGPGSPERGRYLFRDGRGDDGSEPPNNWMSVFGGPAWTRVTEPATGEPGQWYLHLFDSSQPDLDWRNDEVGDMFVDVLEFWLARGVDGFRIDVAHGLVKDADLRDQLLGEGEVPSSDSKETSGSSMVERTLRDEPMWDQPEVHDVYRRWRTVLDERGGMAVAEAWTQTAHSMAGFIRPDELHQAFNFAWLLADWSAEEFKAVVADTFAATSLVGASPTWVLSNHDVERHPTRYGGGEQGRARARAATLAMLALPGSCYLYQGEELGLEQVDVPPEARQDPAWFRAGDDVGRDGCRVPMPWSGDAPPYGFGPGDGQPWLPQPGDWAAHTVEAQRGQPGSTLEFYAAALRARAEHATPSGEDVTLLDLDPDVLAMKRGRLWCLLNCGSEPSELPPGRVVIASGELPDSAEGLPTLPPDTCAWVLV